MSNHFNELLLQTLKEVGIRLERLEGRVDHVINEKADKSDVKDVKTDVRDVKSEIKSISEKLDQKADKSDVDALHEKLDQKADKSDVNALKSDVNVLRDEVRGQGQRLDRIETGIKTIQWTMTAGIAVLGIILAFMRSC